MLFLWCGGGRWWRGFGSFVVFFVGWIMEDGIGKCFKEKFRVNYFRGCLRVVVFDKGMLDKVGGV